MAIVAVATTLALGLQHPSAPAAHASARPFYLGVPSPVWAGSVLPNPTTTRPIRAWIALPTVTCNTIGVVSMRLGYNGLGSDVSPTVEQVGVTAKCARIGGRASYLLFYEVQTRPLPTTAQPVYVASALASQLQPGDIVYLLVDARQRTTLGTMSFALAATDPSGNSLGSWGTTVAGLREAPAFHTAECVIEATPTRDQEGKPTGLPMFDQVAFNLCDLPYPPTDDASEILSMVSGCTTMASIVLGFSTSQGSGFDLAWYYTGIPSAAPTGFPPVAAVCMPFTGRWAHNILTSAPCGPANWQTSDPSCHTTYYGDWATDLFAESGTPVRLMVSSQGVLSFYWIPRRNGSCGQRTVIGVRVNGVNVGSVYFEHLIGAVKSGPITNGMTVGYVHDWGACNLGHHVHIELRDTHAAPNPSAYSCYVDWRNWLPPYWATAGMLMDSHYALGVLGNVAATPKDRCIIQA